MWPRRLACTGQMGKGLVGAPCPTSAHNTSLHLLQTPVWLPGTYEPPWDGRVSLLTWEKVRSPAVRPRHCGWWRPQSWPSPLRELSVPVC